MSIQDQFKIASTVFLFLIISTITYLMIHETSGYFATILHKSKVESILFATAASCGLVALAMLKVKGFWRNLGKFAFMAAIMAGMVIASSLFAAKPLMNPKLSESQLALKAGYESQLVTIRAELSRLADASKDFGGKNPMNKAMIESDRRKLREQEIITSDKLETLLASVASAGPGEIATTAIYHTVFWRIGLELLNLILSVFFRKNIATILELTKASPEMQHHAPEPKRTPVSVPEPAQIDYQPVRFDGLTPKDFVLSMWPDALCRKAGNGFRVYGDIEEKIYLAAGNNAPRSWLNAAILSEKEGRLAS
jgi:hypothetical protein